MKSLRVMEAPYLPVVCESSTVVELRLLRERSPDS